MAGPDAPGATLMPRTLQLSSAALAIVLSAVVLGAVAGEKLGAGVTIKDATAIKDLYASPEKFLGKPVRIDGVVTGVCAEMGCWMALAAADRPEQTVRFKVDHGVAIVFPISARGKEASAEGVFEKIGAGDEEAKEAAREHTAAQPNASTFGTTYQIKASGAVIK